jgi:glycosyltransferase involved in cell wall biosynthesis
VTSILVCLPEVPNRHISGAHGRSVALVRSLQRLGYDTTILAMTSTRDGGTTALLATDGIPVVALDRDGVALADVLNTGFDVIFPCYYELAEQLLPLIGEHGRGARIVIDTVDLHYIRELRQAQVHGDVTGVARAETVRKRELAVYRRADALLAVSEHEQRVLWEGVPGVPVGVVPSVHEVDVDAPGPANRRGAILVGGYHFPPNRDAAHYLCAEIVPRLRRVGYSQRVELVGPYLDDELASFARSQGVEVTGYVPELASLYRSRRVLLSPIRFGAGVKTKVGEALGAGLPVVGTTVGTEGFPANEAIFQLDDPDAFANAVVALDDDAVWRRSSVAGRDLIAAKYGAGRCDRELSDVLGYVLAAPAVAA